MSRIAELVAREEITRYAEKIKQFGITPVSDLTTGGHTHVTQDLSGLGIWGIKNPKPLINALNTSNMFNVVIGFRPSRFHVGHITLARELAYLVQKGGIPYFVVSGHAGGRSLPISEAKEKVDEFLRYVTRLNSGKKINKYFVFSDTHSQEILDIEAKASEAIKLNKVMQLYGWGTDISLRRLREVTSSVATYLMAGSVDVEKPSVVLVDVNQTTHVEIATQVARKLGMPCPTFTFRSLLSSLKGVQNRMSTKDPKSVIYLDDSKEIIAQKLLQSISGGRETPAQQREMGGQIEKCSFVRVVDPVLFNQASDEIFGNCTSGGILCGECKRLGTSLFLKGLAL